MTEASWGEDVQNPPIDWKMSAALENVVRSGEDLPEVTNLEGTVREWMTLDPEHRRDAVITPERAVVIDGAPHERLTADGIALLAAQLPA